jgi:hypothetical protein
MQSFVWVSAQDTGRSGMSKNVVESIAAVAFYFTENHLLLKTVLVEFADKRF